MGVLSCLIFGFVIIVQPYTGRFEVRMIKVVVGVVVVVVVVI